MTQPLNLIIEQKYFEVEQLKEQLRSISSHPLHYYLNGYKKRQAVKSFKSSLKQSSLSVIAEIKRRSPSKGPLADIQDAVKLAQTYVEGGANAISVLTDERFFGGCLKDLSNVSLALNAKPQPVLRKDFIINEIQIAEAILAGADAILVIVAVLGMRTKDMVLKARELNIDALVEVHNHEELELALESGAEIIGINNRDLKTMHMNTNLAFELVGSIPDGIVKVAESGILDPSLAQEYYQAGFDAVLIGEALVKSSDPKQFIKDCRHVANTPFN